MCKFCDEDRIINHSCIWFGKEGEIATINSNNELTVNINGEQMNIPIEFCPFCGNKLLK